MLQTVLLLLQIPTLILAVTPSPGCTTQPASGSPLVTRGITNHTTTINSKQRTYLLNIPPSYTGSSTFPARLIFTLHAAGGNSSMVRDGVGGYLPWYGLPTQEEKLAENPGAIYVAPDGLDRGWANRGGEDTAFITEIARDLKNAYCVDEDLVFSVGFSYGASMSYALACASSLGTDEVLKFRAVAVQSGGNMSGCVTGDGLGPRSVALYGQHGVDGDLNLGMARRIRDQFVEANGCRKVEAGEEVVLGTGGHVKRVYQGCREDLPVTWVEYDGGHTPRPMDKGTNGSTWAAEETWGFLNQFYR
ncbi:alpha/beta-hydrolase [Rhypophila decipiens]